MKTYPNQKVLHINKQVSDSYFLQVDKSDWMNASNELTYNAFKVYLYLAGNQNGFDLALSGKAIMEEIKMHSNTYTKVIKELTEKGYIVHEKGNRYNFYTVPDKTKEDKTNVPYECMVSSECMDSHSSVNDTHTTVGDTTTLQCESIPHSSGGERYKRDKREKNIYKENISSNNNPLKRKINYEDISEETKCSIHSYFIWTGRDRKRVKEQYKQIPEDIVDRIIDEKEAEMPFN